MRDRNIRFFSAMLKKGDYCLDIGANRGEVAYYISKSVGNSGKVICFEPIAKTREFLADTIKKFDLTNVIICPNALGSKNENASMFVPIIAGVNRLALAHIYKYNKSTNMVGNPILNGTFENVNMLTLDCAMEILKLNKLDFIKCDAEGYEFEILDGAEKTVHKYKPLIFVEIWAAKFLNVEHFKKLNYFLKRFNYEIKILFDGELKDIDIDLIKKNGIQDYFLTLKK